MKIRRLHSVSWAAISTAFLLLTPGPILCAEGPREESNAPDDDLPRLIANLDADRFDDRRHAAERLEE
ncbi:MAG TPA: hypothetical protein VGX78_06995, partial [Pirellulales bacterium]|nr:hypothetical protein [Pirellulales bacterium]